MFLSASHVAIFFDRQVVVWPAVHDANLEPLEKKHWFDLSVSDILFRKFAFRHRNEERAKLNQCLKHLKQLIHDLSTVDWGSPEKSSITRESAAATPSLARVGLGNPIFAIVTAESKLTCENTFDSVWQSKTNKFSPVTKWMYLQVCRYAKAGGANPLVPQGHHIEFGSKNSTHRIPNYRKFRCLDVSCFYSFLSNKLRVFGKATALLSSMLE